MSANRVGGDVDAYCTKCKMILGHTTIAMVGEKIARVRCNTCQGLHAYKAGPPGTKAATKRATTTRAKAGTGRAAKEKVEVRPFEELFAGRDESQARPYSPRERFADDEIMSHPTFGLGLVRNARHDKVDVVFKQGEKTLVHALASGASRQPVSFQKHGSRQSQGSSAADKPPPGQPTGLHVVPNVPLSEMPKPAVEKADAEGTAAEESVQQD